MIVNEPACDYLTIGTFSREVADQLLTAMDTLSPQVAETQRRMQYEGLAKGSIFCGSALQREKMHYLFQASGSIAQPALNLTAPLQTSCTRIDIQLTMIPPVNYHHRSVYEALKRSVDAPHCSIIESGDGLDTIYIGRRSARRFIRLYMKLADDGRRWLRFEAEYKRELAKSIHKELCASEDPQRLMASLLLGELQFTPILLSLLHGFAERLEKITDCGRQPSDGRVATSGRTYRWLTQQVNPAIMRAMYDHDEGPAVRKLVTAWAAEAQMIDEM